MRNIAFALATTGLLMSGSVAAQEAVIQQQGADELLGSWVIGSAVTSVQGERIGSIDDVILEPEEGVITAAVISVGGFLGFGAKSIAVEWSELAINWDAREITLNMSREEMEESPEYAFREREYMPAADEPVGGMDTGGDALGGGGALDGGGAMDGADEPLGAEEPMDAEEPMEGDEPLEGN